MKFSLKVILIQNKTNNKRTDCITINNIKMKNIKIVIVLILTTTMLSCVSSKKYNALNKMYKQSLDESKICESNLTKFQSLNDELTRRNKSLEEQLDYLKKHGDQMLNTLQDLSVLNSKQAESMKESLKRLSEKEGFIDNLQAELKRKDSLNMLLVMNLKSSLQNINDNDVNIQVEKGVVYIDISDKLLFNTGKYEVTDKAKNVLGKIASVLNSHPELDVMVEGHTDNVPIRTDYMADNWDLSVLRATSVIRILQTNYKISPVRMTAAGHSEYDPIASNDNVDGRTLNRRTRIVLLPQLDQFFKLLAKNQ
jgi:chemotaxis protein MotB